MKTVKCKGCGQTGLYSIHNQKNVSGEGFWYWARCARCGFHTSSYRSKEDAKLAARLGEQYISENGNKCFTGVKDNPQLMKEFVDEVLVKIEQMIQDHSISVDLS